MKAFKYIIAIYGFIFRSAFQFIKEVFTDRQTIGDMFHRLGLIAGCIIFDSIAIAISYLFMRMSWTFTPDHEFFWIITVLGGLCLCFKIGDWLKGE